MFNQTDDFSDIDIIRKVVSGDVNIFEALIERYQSYVFSIVYKHIPAELADEIAHDVFVRAYHGLAGFSEKSHFKHWLSGIAVRTCYDFWRKKYRQREVPFSELTDAHQEWLENTTSDNAEKTYENQSRQDEAIEILEWAMEKMSAADRMVLELTYLEGHTHKETAALLKWSVANVKIRAHRAKKKLHKILMEQMEQHQEEV